MNNSQKCKYMVLNKKGFYEEWTGIFNNINEAYAWYRKYGKFHESRGHNLELKFINN